MKYRLDKAVDVLGAIPARQLAAAAPGAGARWPGRMVRACDGTCIRERGSAAADWRVHGLHDLGRGGFADLRLTDKHGAEATDKHGAEATDKHGAEALDRPPPSRAGHGSLTAALRACPACCGSAGTAPRRPTSSSGSVGTPSACAGRMAAHAT